ncbi:hypothetical protein P9112_006018 [Eukaryota sp. TZLM1-RC]
MEGHAQPCLNSGNDFVPDAPHTHKSDICTSQNSPTRTLTDLYLVPHPTTNEPSFRNEELASSSHRSKNRCSPLHLRCTSHQCPSHPHPSDLQSDLKPDSIGHDGCTLQHVSSDPTIDNSSPVDQKLTHFPDRSQRLVGVKSISADLYLIFLLTHSGEVYAWGDNDKGPVLYDGPDYIKSPVKFSLNHVVTISAKGSSSLALRSDGNLYIGGWMLGNSLLPFFTLKNIHCGEINGGFHYSFTETQEGQVVHW